MVRSDLLDVLAICEAHKKQTNHHRQLIKDLAKGSIPASWRRFYTLPKQLLVAPWMSDFADRVKQMTIISRLFADEGIESLKTSVVWLGGLFAPEAYITATRQYVAQTNSLSLEELVLSISVHEDPSTVDSVRLDQFSFGVTGLKLQGAQCADNKLVLSTNITNDFPLAIVRWSRAENAVISKNSGTIINLPVYLNGTRAELLFKVDMQTDQKQTLFYMRGVAIVASSLA
jgi:dynein heavy chain 1